MDPKTNRVFGKTVLLAAILFAAMTTRTFAGVVQLNCNADEQTIAQMSLPTSEQMSLPTSEPLALATGMDVDVADDVIPALPAEPVATAADDRSGWMALVTEPATSTRAHLSEVQDPPRAVRVTGATAPATAVIPLPPAVWSGLMTLGAAGLFAIRSRSGRRL